MHVALVSHLLQFLGHSEHFVLLSESSVKNPYSSLQSMHSLDEH